MRGDNLKVTAPSSQVASENDMIYRGDRREIMVIDHGKKSYMVVDGEMIEKLGNQMQGLEKQLADALKNAPPEQRAMLEKMMRDRMPPQAQAQSAPKPEVRRTGETGTHSGYPCVKYEVFTEGRKVRELWVTDWDNVEGGKEAVGAFEGMSDFFAEFRAALPFQQNQASDNAFEHMRENRWISRCHSRVRRQWCTRARGNLALNAETRHQRGGIRASCRPTNAVSRSSTRLASASRALQAPIDRRRPSQHPPATCATARRP